MTRLCVAILLLSTLLCGRTSYAQTGPAYSYTVNLTDVEKDRVKVDLLAPAIQENEINFALPKIVPGTYEVEDYGRYVSDFQPVDRNGKKLPFKKIDDNTWHIKHADRLYKISYWVDDSFDTPMKGPEIFWPARTNIEEGKDFIVNTPGFFGYFDGMQKMPVKFTIIHPASMTGMTGLIPVAVNEPTTTINIEKIDTDTTRREDTYLAEDFDELFDSPLMYAAPDTALIQVANTQVLVGCYSPNHEINARQIASSIKQVLLAQKEYLGGNLPVNKYAFLFYFTDKPVTEYGALEHNYSSMYFMPEMTIDDMNQQLRDFAAHEFFHVITPLTVHSEEIGHFDFSHPKMSEHLWMYEGVTEYFAGNVQVKYGLIDRVQYMNMLREKMLEADNFNDTLPFTDLSKYTITKYHDQYDNVYQKGALIGLCLDIELRKLSGGSYGLRNLLLDLSKKFGKDKPFEDDSLFSIITKMTYPQIGDFLHRYVGGDEPLPFKEIFEDVGIHYSPSQKVVDYSLGLNENSVGITTVNGVQYIDIEDDSHLDAMGQALGYKNGDVLRTINGERIPDLGPGLTEFFQNQREALPNLDTLKVGVWRKDKSGYKDVELSAKVTQIEMVYKHLIQADPSPTAEQVALREAWLSAN